MNDIKKKITTPVTLTKFIYKYLIQKHPCKLQLFLTWNIFLFNLTKQLKFVMN